MAYAQLTINFLYKQIVILIVENIGMEESLYMVSLMI